MIRSMTTLGTALPINRPLVDPQVPGSSRFQFFLTGWHMNNVPKKMPNRQRQG